MIAANNIEPDKGGQGEPVSDMLIDEHRTRSDLVLMKRAINRWPGMIGKKKRKWIDRLDKIAEKEVCMVMTKQGPVSLDGPADANAIAAINCLRLMEAQNQADEHKSNGNSPAGNTTIYNNTQINVAATPAQCSDMAQLAASLGCEILDSGKVQPGALVVDPATNGGLPGNS